MENEMERAVKPSVKHHDPDTSLKEGLEQNRLAPAQNMSPEEIAVVEKRLKRKLDLRLLCCVWVIFVMNYLDRVRRLFNSLSVFNPPLLVLTITMIRTISRQQRSLVYRIL
jgi:hypothetical protein